MGAGKNNRKPLRVLVLEPITVEQKGYLEERVSGGQYDVSFAWSSKEKVTRDELRQADVILGNAPVDLLKEIGGKTAPACTAKNGGAPALFTVTPEEGEAGAAPQEKAPHLLWLQLAWAGADAYTAPGVLTDDTILTCSSGAYGTSVSEHMLALTMMLVRRLDEYGRQQARHVWKDLGRVTSVEDAVVLVLGLGDIGGRYAEKMHALGAHVIGVRRHLHGSKAAYLEEEHTMDDLDQLLPRADIVAMVLPGGVATVHVMNESRLRLLKKGAYLINAGRGNAIDLAALRKVLQEGKLGGVGLDVTEPEPLPQEDPLWDMDRVVITPHVAGKYNLQKTVDHIVRIAGENLHAFTHGQPLQHVVDRKTGY